MQMDIKLEVHCLSMNQGRWAFLMFSAAVQFSLPLLHVARQYMSSLAQ